MNQDDPHDPMHVTNVARYHAVEIIMSLSRGRKNPQRLRSRLLGMSLRRLRGIVACVLH